MREHPQRAPLIPFLFVRWSPEKNPDIRRGAESPAIGDRTATALAERRSLQGMSRTIGIAGRQNGVLPFVDRQ